MFTNAEVTEALVKVVDDRGHDFVYMDEDGTCASVGDCKYRHRADPEADYDDTEVVPGCIIGAVVYELDKDLFYTLAEGVYFTGQGPRVTEQFSSEVLHALQVAQHAQDRDENWGDALKDYYNSLNGTFDD